MKLKKENLMPAIVLSVICIVVALLLSLVNLVTGPIIKDAQNAAANAALTEVLPGITGTPEEITVDDKYPSVITKAYKADVGYVFQATVTGKSSGLIIMCGISNDGKITGTKVIAEQETDDYDAKVFPNVEGTDGVYTGMNLESFEPYLVSGATLTSKAYSEAIKASLQAFAIAGGAEVDLRTPEEIIQDNCNAALGTTDVSFTKWFKTEIINGIDGIYESEEGTVYVIGESFVGIKDGMVITSDASEDAKATALAADNAKTQSTLTAITELPDGLPANFVEAYATASGNYVITAKGAGYGIDGHWNASGEYIRVKISISHDGKIIDTATLYHSETEDIGGAALSNPDFVGKFEGKTKDDYASVEGVSGATMTSDGYKGAIRVAFEAFELIKGGTN